MQGAPLPLTRDIVLIGGGHTHALVLRKWGMDPLPGARLTLINPGPTAPYSGMLPGHVAGHYDREALDIDLVRLARFAGARLILGAARGIDLAARQVEVPDRPPVGFDLCSIDIGITSHMPDVPGFAAHAVPAKPLGPFATRWQEFLAGDGAARVAVIGGGVAGAELAMAMAFALHGAGRPAQVHLIEAGRALNALGIPARARILQALRDQGVTLLENAPVTAIEDGHVTLDNGNRIEAGFITGAAGARPYDWLGQTGLELHDGFVTVSPRLQSSDPAVFAVGDCAHLAYDPRPKAGVYAVRQAPVLFANLRAAAGTTAWKLYRPQKDYLKLVSLGRKSAMGERLGLPFEGPLVWRWKDRIDQAFMEKFRSLPRMPTPALPRARTRDMEAALGPKPLCGGCGAKLARGPLAAVLDRLPGHPRDDVEPLPGDDAALLRTGGARQVLSTDHLRAFTHDPVLQTRITAIHALGDIWAMGAEPQAATANLILPRASEPLQRRILAEIMATAHAVMAEAGAAIVGGHSSLGDELTVGFSLTGLCEGAPITLAGGRPGDVLLLTKPLGSGTVLAAEMAAEARGEWVAAAHAQMAQPQGAASRILAGAHAMTDVTGFGLAGHLQNLCAASGCGARIELSSVPLMVGAEALAAQGVRATLFEANRSAAPQVDPRGRAALLFDPQTAGGLLAAVPADAAEALLRRLRDAGYPAARIGALVDGPPVIEVV